MSPPVHVGLTGGIGSGKSTVAKLLQGCGAALMDADGISRALTAPGGQAIEPIAQTFGPQYITPAGALDRTLMRTLAFSDPAAKHRLEAIIHPLVSQVTWQLARQATEAGYRCLVFDIPLLVESSTWRGKVDRVLVVDCSESTQIDRVMARDTLQREAVLAIIAAQAGRKKRLQAADAVIFNDGLALQDLAAQVAVLAPCFGLSLQP